MNRHIIIILLMLFLVVFTNASVHAANFSDDFRSDTIAEYSVTNTWTGGGVGSLQYDAAGQRAQVLTGNNIALLFSHALPATSSGTFSMDVLPVIKYPPWGVITIRLRQDQDNYYEIRNTDGSGDPAEIIKVVNGIVVESALFQHGYTQNNNYHIRIEFSPGNTVISAFNEEHSLNVDTSSIVVQSLEVGSCEQDVYYDNIIFTDDTIPPVWDSTVGIVSVTDMETGGNAEVAFGTATDATDGSNVDYNIYYAQTSLWNTDWNLNNVVSVGSSPYTITGLIDNIDYTFGVRTADQSGNEELNTTTLTVIPSGGESNFSDNFSIDTISEYQVTNTWTGGGVGSLLYDATGKRAQVLTGDNIALLFSHALPAASSGTFSIDALPMTAYPLWGMITIRLRQDQDNYYEIRNTDGSGGSLPEITKVVNGVIVESALFQNSYVQNNNYHIRIKFSPENTEISAFGELHVLNADNSTIIVNSLEIGSAQQDIYYDNILLTNDIIPPVWDSTAGIDSVTDLGTGGSIEVVFGTATDAIDGANVNYNIYYAETSSWNTDWMLNNVVSTSGSPYTINGLLDNIEYTFGIRAADQAGNEDINVVTLSAIPSGDDIPPVWDSTIGIVSVVDTATGESIEVAFGTATDAVDGSNVDYNIYYAQTSLWNTDWSLNNFIPAGNNPYTITGLVDNIEYTFGVRAADQSGNEESNTATLTVIPSGGESIFSDNFSINTISEYQVTNTWTGGGVGSLLYDAAGERAQVLTGDDIALLFSHTLPTSSSGVFRIDVLPVARYPSWGMITIRLRQDQDNYYEIRNTDGSGGSLPVIMKVVNGVVVESALFQNSYVQNNNYQIRIEFSPGYTEISAFGELHVFNTDNSTIIVNSVEIGSAQQDIYYDNISFTNDTISPLWDGTVGITSATDMGTGGSIEVAFGTATDAIDGTDVDYNIYYAETSSWNTDWNLNNVVSAGGSPFTITDLVDNIEYTFGVRTVDQSGNEDVNTSTLTTIPSGGESNFSDDFSIDTISDYEVTNTWTGGGVGSLLHDATGERAQVLTGDDIALLFSHALPAASSGIFSIDILPIAKYPPWGMITIRLRQDQDNYYEIRNTDGPGYTPEIKKVVDGIVVESELMQNSYTQNNTYNLIIDFSPETTTFYAFNEEHSLSSDTNSIVIKSFEVGSCQQDIYYDNIYYLVDQPFVKIVEPVSDYFQENDNLVVKAIAGQLQTDWGIKFLLDSSTTIVDLVPPFEADFIGLVPGEHIIEAFVFDNTTGSEVPGLMTHHTIENVAIGDYYVAIGNSITYGSDDDVQSDDTSTDGRNTGGGYEPILNNLLTAFYEYPHNIINEGIPGDTSADGVSNIASILARHVNASRVLVLYGTNDAGLEIPRDSFKGNMQQIIDAINNSGKEVCLSKIPIASSLDQRNLWIQEYNEVIDELVADISNSITVTPPDFYTYFGEETAPNHFRYEDEFATELHPNGIGYQSMANLWYQALTQ